MSTWEELGAQRMPVVHPGRDRDGRRPPAGDASWLIRSPDGTPQPWAVHAAHRPLLERDGVQHGLDAWRVVVKVHEHQVLHERSRSDVGWFESFDVVVESEQEAVDLVVWLLGDAEKGTS